MDWQAVGGLCAVVAAVFWLVPSPKDRMKEREAHITGRLSVVEKDARTLQLQFVQLSERVNNLVNVCKELTVAIKELTHATRGK